MNEKEISVLLKKADELRSLFVLGQRVIPFLEEIFVFVNDIEPLLNEINSSIEENLKRMPNASKQLSKVTEATELATTEIMDIVDGINNKSDKINGFLDNIKDTSQNGFDSNIELLEIVRDGIQNNDDMSGALPELNKAIDKLKTKKEEQFGSKFNEVQEELQNISMDTSSIMMSLQVQDITSQQIAAVNNLLETVQKKLSGILKKFNENDISEFIKEEEGTNVSKMHRDIAFDPDAVDSMSVKESRQSEVDKYMEEQLKEDEDDSGEASQDDIDAMFENDTLDEEAETKSPRTQEHKEENQEAPKDTKSEEKERSENINDQSEGEESQENESKDKQDVQSGQEEQSEDKDSGKDDEINDIDDGDEEFSQEDIDKLFNS